MAVIVRMLVAVMMAVSMPSRSVLVMMVVPLQMHIELGPGDTPLRSATLVQVITFQLQLGQFLLEPVCVDA